VLTTPLFNFNFLYYMANPKLMMSCCGQGRPLTSDVVKALPPPPGHRACMHAPAEMRPQKMPDPRGVTPRGWLFVGGWFVALEAEVECGGSRLEMTVVLCASLERRDKTLRVYM